MMEKFSFLIGKWKLDYQLPKSDFHAAASGTGSGVFKRELNNKFVFFDYFSFINDEKHNAYGIFGWDKKIEQYRYWWFEDSGVSLSATCNFVNDNKLIVHWHDTLLVQTFTQVKPD
ncbi:MAG: hypothetical protein K9M80_07170 [Candidatus Marinimicrobia bacterium]|nr:hypothetical protein [Candidatus Neomarinimicrobiota bacterium]